jgi:SAM-dependent methyltransferase
MKQTVPQSAIAPFWHLDEPSLLNAQTDGELFNIRGWIACNFPPTDIQLSPKSSEDLPDLQLELELRNDVAPALGIPGIQAIGFKGCCPSHMLEGIDGVEIQYTIEQKKYTFYAPHLQKSNTTKLEKITPYLCCPQCHSELEGSETKLSCSLCHSDFPINQQSCNFLTSELREKFKVIPTDNVSANAYDATAIDIINRKHTGLVLDCGAGYRTQSYDNVINYEIVDYSSTDIVGVGEKLPFKTATFDAIFSFAVLEHVVDPFLCAREILRVLKPGGTLYCQVPFLQPFHGYPNHFYNMTSQGLFQLFSPHIDVDELAVVPSGQPIAALTWLLSAYTQGLPEDIRNKFLNMTVEDLLSPGNNPLTADHVLELNEKTKDEISSCNYLLGTKR